MKTMNLKWTAMAAVLVTAMLSGAVGAQCLSGAGWKAAAKPTVWTPSNGAARLLHAAYEPGEGDGNPHTIVGMWHMKLVAGTITLFNNAPELPFPEGAEFDAGYQQWHNDGTEMLNSGGRPPFTSSFCMGVWEQTGPRTYKLNHFAIAWSNLATRTGPTSIVEEVTLSPDGKTFAGHFTITDYLETDSPAGSSITKQDTVSGPITATRIDVNTPVEPIF
jgi:hypothetical protein